MNESSHINAMNDTYFNGIIISLLHVWNVRYRNRCVIFAKQFLCVQFFFLFSFEIFYNSLNFEFHANDTNRHWNGMYDGWFAAVFVTKRVGKF